MASYTLKRKPRLSDPDELVTLTDKFIRGLKPYRNHLITAAIAIVVVIAAVAFFQIRNRHNTIEAFGELGRQLTAYENRLNGDDPSGAYTAVKAPLQSLIRDFGGNNGGKMARLVLASISLSAGAVDEAIDQYQQAASDFGDDPWLSNIIYHGLGQAYEQKKEVKQAAAAFERVLTGTNPLLKDAALFNLARLYDQMGQVDQRDQALSQLSTDFPNSMFAGIAGAKTSG